MRDAAFALLVAGLVVAASTGGGWLYGRSQVRAQWEADKLRAARVAAEERAAAVQAVQDRLVAETARGDALSRRLAETETRLTKTQQELNREIARTTTGRPCLDARTVGLLNRAGQGGAADAGAVPETAGAPAAAHAAVATDTDVALWASDARIQYDTCRARLDALIDYEEHRQ